MPGRRPASVAPIGTPSPPGWAGGVVGQAKCEPEPNFGVLIKVAR
jgi:hypothetical protein